MNDISENILHRIIPAISESSERKLEERRNFVSKLTCHSPMNNVWNMVNKKWQK